MDWVKSGRRWSLAACYSCFVLSFLAKQILVTLPFVFLLLDYWQLGRLRERLGRAQVVLEKLPLLAISAAFSAITLLAQSSGRAVTPLESLPLWARSLNASSSFMRSICGKHSGRWVWRFITRTPARKSRGGRSPFLPHCFWPSA